MTRKSKRPESGNRRLTDTEAALLAVLADGPLHGFEAGRKASELLGKRFDPTAYYRPLHALERADLVSGFWESEADATRHPGPRRRFYRLKTEMMRAVPGFEQVEEPRASGLELRGAAGL